MIIWGSGGGTSVLGELEERDCPVCEKRTPFQATVYYKYFHIWYLFSFLTDREYLAVCGHCGNGIPLDKAEVKRAFPRDGIPFIRKKGWLIVLVLALAVFAGAFAENRRDKERYQEYMSMPQVGDIYLVDLGRVVGSGYVSSGKTAYGYMSVVQIADDKQVFVVCKEAYSKKSGVRKALSPGVGKNAYDLEDPLALSREDVQKLFDSGIIYEIRR